MAPYIFGHRNKIHIINLETTMAMYLEAMKFTRQLSSNKGTILFVGTKRQAREIIKEEAERCGTPYVDYRWLGGMLTNFKTVKQSIKRLKDMEQMVQDGSIERLPKKEALHNQREIAKLQRSLGGIKELNALPDALFVIDVGYQKGAVAEAKKLGIPIIAVVDATTIRKASTCDRATTTRAVQSGSMRAALPTRCWKAAARSCKVVMTRNSSRSRTPRHLRPDGAPNRKRG